MDSILETIAAKGKDEKFTIRTSTIPRLVGGVDNPHKGRVVTESTLLVMKGSNYADLMKQNEKSVGSRKWGTVFDEENAFIDNDGSIYIGFVVVEVKSTQYKLMGKEVQESAIIGLSRPRQSSPVTYRTFNLDSIVDVI